MPLNHDKFREWKKFYTYKLTREQTNKNILGVKYQGKISVGKDGRVILNHVSDKQFVVNVWIWLGGSGKGTSANFHEHKSQKIVSSSLSPPPYSLSSKPSSPFWEVSAPL
jgi:flagellar biogenesis protein FliO